MLLVFKMHAKVLSKISFRGKPQRLLVISFKVIQKLKIISAKVLCLIQFNSIQFKNVLFQLFLSHKTFIMSNENGPI